MQTTTIQLKDNVIQCYLLGMKQSEIAKKLGTSDGNVSNILKEMKNKLGSADVEETILLNRYLREAGLKTSDLIPVARLYAKLKKLDLDSEYDNLESFLHIVYQGCKNLNIPPQNLFDAAVKLFEIKTDEIPIEQVSQYCQELLVKKTDLKDKIQTLETRAKTVQLETRKILDENMLTHKIIHDYITTKTELANLGLPISDLPKLSNILRQAFENKFDISQLIQLASNEGTFRQREYELRKLVKELERQVQEKNKENKLLDEKIGSNKDLTFQLARLESLKINSQDMDRFYNILKTIAKKKKLDPKEILAKLEEEVESQYDTKLGFEQEIKTLSEKHEVVLQEFNTLTENQKTEKKRDSNIMQKLASEIIILKKQKQDLELEIKNIVEITKKSILDVNNISLQTIENAGTFTVDKIQYVTDQSVTKLAENSTKIQEEMQNSAKTFDETISEISRASEEFGKIQSLTPIHGIIINSQGEPTKVYPSMLSLLDGFIPWLTKQKIRTFSSIRSDAVKLRNEIHKEMMEHAKSG